MRGAREPWGVGAPGGALRHLSSGNITIVKLQPGDLLVEGLEAVLRETYTRNAVVQFGIGSLASAEYGVLPPEGPHRRFHAQGPVELVHLSGLVVGKDSAGPYGSHLHIAVAGPDGTLRGGHLFAAEVGLVAEVGMVALHDSRLKRVRDPAREIDILEF